MARLPSGTVTFLFTDIERSTKLWEDHPEAMPIALERHDSILREAIERNDGYIVKTTGDGVLAAFHTATDALASTLAAQQSLLAATWPDPVTIRVRMGLHTGAVNQREDDYFGPTLNRTARLMSVGYGGQILLSAVTQELCRDSLPPGVTLLNLGEHRLKDLNRPETLYQVIHPALPSAFPALKTLNNPDLPHNLPLQVTSFIGREKEIVDLKDLVKTTRLVTLTGPGGCGKTRLSQQVAADLLDEFVDGVWLIELASLADPGLVPQAVAQVLGIREQADRPVLQSVVEGLKGKQLLLLLDNCEHLLEACARLAAALIRSCPEVRILATSREHLGVAGERIYRVPPLSLPDPQQSTTPESLSPFESVRLFVERGLFHKRDFAVTNENAPALAQLCYRLDGIPLAIELAAARVRSLSVEDINARLDNRFRLLTGGDRSALPRQQTLRALVDWSYDLLNDAEQVLLARLAVFSGGWTVEMAEAVCGFAPLEDWEVLDLLTSLVDKSLALAEESSDGATRYRMFETIRQYAEEKQEASEERQVLNGRHRDAFMELAEESESQLKGPDQVAWFGRLEREHDNLRKALAWCIAEGNVSGAEAGLRVCGALWHFWEIRGYLSEGRDQCRRVLAAWNETSGAPTEFAAKARMGASVLALNQGDLTSARSLLEESAAIVRALGDRRAMASVLGNLGNVAFTQGDYEAARRLYEEILAVFREFDSKHGIATALMNLGVVAERLGDYPAARRFYEESLALRREMSNTLGVASVLDNLGNLALAEGDRAAAQPLYEESLVLRQEIGNRQGIANSLDNLAELSFANADLERGITLRAAADALRASLGASLTPDEQSSRETQTIQARSQLGEAFDALWTAGHALTEEQAVAFALQRSLVSQG